MRTLVVAVALIAVLIGLPTVGAQDDPMSEMEARRSTPVLLLTGYDHTGQVGGPNSWERDIDRLTDWGWADVRPVGYYVCDVDPDDMHAHGEHGKHHGGPSGHGGDADTCSLPAPAGPRHDRDTSLRHLGYHFAWYVHDVFENQCVNAIGGSLGGLIVRYAIAAVEAGDLDMPGPICVQNVLTFATPHAGVVVPELCADVTVQCQEFMPGSPFIDWLGEHGKHPQGAGGTRWLVIGSDADETVPSSSAIHMDADQWLVYDASQGIDHGDFLESRQPRATSRYTYGPSPDGASGPIDGYWPLRTMDRFLAEGRWDCGFEAAPIPMGVTSSSHLVGAAGECWVSVQVPWSGVDLTVRTLGHKSIRLEADGQDARCSRPETGLARCVLDRVGSGTYVFRVHLGDSADQPDEEVFHIATRGAIGPIIEPEQTGAADNVHQAVDSAATRFIFFATMALATSVVVLALLLFRRGSSVRP